MPHQPPLVVIVGPTASGKSALAMRLARQFDGEIIAADSRTVYRGMDIGTAKPTPQDQQIVKHHLIDVVEPNERFTVADFKNCAVAAIADIAARGKTPFLVGGSGLYIDAVLYNFTFRKPANVSERERFEVMSVEALQALLAERAIALPANKSNPRHLIRSLETNGQTPERAALRPNTLILGIGMSKEALELAIRERIDRMIEGGFIQEVETLATQYGQSLSAFDTPGYKEFKLYLDGELSLEEAKQQFVRAHLQYAKRQMTWFKRNKDIVWISKTEGAVDLVTTFLNK